MILALTLSISETVGQNPTGYLRKQLTDGRSLIAVLVPNSAEMVKNQSFGFPKQFIVENDETTGFKNAIYYWDGFSSRIISPVKYGAFTVPAMTFKQARDGLADTTSVISIVQGLRGGYFKKDTADTTTPDDSSMTIIIKGIRYKRMYEGPLYLEWFGAVGGENFSSSSGEICTYQIQKAINYAARYGSEIRLRDALKYRTGALYANYDSTYNKGFVGRPGRVKITGGASGLATGLIEVPGSALVHVNGSSRPLFSCIGKWSESSAGETGGHIVFEGVNFIGGNQTSSVIYFELVVGQVELKNFTVRVANPAGNGITENNTWEAIMSNVLIRGQATGTGSWTGIGLYITSNNSEAQSNMKEYNQINVYKMGVGIRVGRGLSTTGTISGLRFNGGQCSLSDQQNMWLDGGTYNLISKGQQFEGARLNAIRIDSDGSNDLTRNVTFEETYFTGNGRIGDNSENSFVVLIKDGEGVTFERPLFNNMTNGISFDQKTQDLFIINPVIRTVTTEGAASGTFVAATGTADITKRHFVENANFNQTPFTKYNAAAEATFSRNAAGGYIGVSNNSATPSVSMGGTIDRRARFLNFNNSSVTTVTNLLNPQQLKLLTLTSSNSNTTITNNANISLNAGQPFQLVVNSSITLYHDGTKWREVSRNDQNGIVTAARTATTNGSSTDVIIAHNLGVVPTWFSVLATNATAAGFTYVTADATNIIIHYTTAPAAGTANYNMQYKK